MASFDSLVKKKVELFESVPEKLQTSALKTQALIWKRIEPILQEMDVDSSGNISQTEGNIRRIAVISEELKTVRLPTKRWISDPSAETIVFSTTPRGETDLALSDW